MCVRPWPLGASLCGQGPSLTRHGAQLEVDFHNPGPTYLGAGDSPLPTLFLLCSLAFSVLLAGWVFLMCRNRDEVGANVAAALDPCLAERSRPLTALSP